MTNLIAPQFNGKAHTKMQALAKPIGAICNIDCSYCYYLGKKELLNYSKSDAEIMSGERLETYIKQYIEAQNTPEIIFSWHGGEPTLLGVDYFKKVVELQKKHCPEHSLITNDIQTNATLLDDEWCRFFKQNEFVVGVSIDGPEHIHNRYRTNKAGRGTFKQTFRGIELLKKHHVKFATLTCVNDLVSTSPLEVYRFLRDEIAPSQMQFIPVVDKIDAPIKGKWHSYASQSIIPVSTKLVTDWSVTAEQWGSFLISVFNEWLYKDFGKVFIPYFDNFFAVWAGQASSMCTLSDICGKGLAIEPNGDVYSCDHYVYEQFKLGNFQTQSLQNLAFSARQQSFGFAKQKALPLQCKRCDYKFACHGECPKNRIIKSVDGEEGLNYLCSGWHKFFKHIDPIVSQILTRNNISLGER